MVNSVSAQSQIGDIKTFSTRQRAFAMQSGNCFVTFNEDEITRIKKF